MKTVRIDERTPEQKKTHTWLVIGTDRFLSGWGLCEDGPSYAAWACKPEHRGKVFTWVKSRSDMKRVRETTDPYYPTGCEHLHIYVVGDNHPAINTQ